MTHTPGSGGYGADFLAYLEDSFDVLYEERRRWPMMMSVGLHMRMAGRPGQIKAVGAFLRCAKARSGVWITTRRAIAKAFCDATEPRA